MIIWHKPRLRAGTAAIVAGLWIAAGGIAAGQKVTVGVSPVPVWSGEGSLPPSLENETVFADPAAGELIVVAGRRPDGAPERLLRIELENRAVTLVSAKVSRAAGGGFLYEYELAVETTSRRPLAEWQVWVPDDPDLRVEVPPLWSSRGSATGIPDRFVAGPALLRTVSFIAPPGQGLPSGGATAGLRLISGFLPGYVTAFARSVPARPFPATELASLPETLQQRIREILSSPWSAQPVTVPGPRFAPGTSPPVRAAALHHSIQHFVVSGRLQGDSQFVREALSTLWSRMQSGIEVPFRPEELAFLDTARTAAEKELVEVMRLSLLENPQRIP